jgi:hypothetical protein
MDRLHQRYGVGESVCIAMVKIVSVNWRRLPLSVLWLVFGGLGSWCSPSSQAIIVMSTRDSGGLKLKVRALIPAVM